MLWGAWLDWLPTVLIETGLLFTPFVSCCLQLLTACVKKIFFCMFVWEAISSMLVLFHVLHLHRIVKGNIWVRQVKSKLIWSRMRTWICIGSQNVHPDARSCGLVLLCGRIRRALPGGHVCKDVQQESMARLACSSVLWNVCSFFFHWFI